MELGLLLVGLAEAVTSDSVRADDNPLVDKVKSTWRAHDGETVEQIISKVAKVVHFVPRTWGVSGGIDQSEYVFLSWTRHRDNRSLEEYVIAWKVTPDGTIKIASTYAKPMELGWRAFALSLIAGEVTDGEKDVNLRFLHDQANFNFVTTAQGKLGNLLGHGRCTIVEPVFVDYFPKVDENQTTKGDLWRVLLWRTAIFRGPVILPARGSSPSRNARDKSGNRNPSCQAYRDISLGLMV
ncbi:nodulate formation efficiency C protein [Bradyrhizobium yuanmingense]|uniref:Nodulate formation efficiency C protein n=1 Tax=Bradyrhizobium yuanmingense TaxID=108015 RepID=A0ABV4G7I9_9BRAD|nr:nodulate formation efficiency C protein [Bradyrhizobium yuanmingense]